MHSTQFPQRKPMQFPFSSYYNRLLERKLLHFIRQTKKEPSLYATYRAFAVKMKMVYSRCQCKCTFTFSFYHKMFTSNFGIAFGTQ